MRVVLVTRGYWPAIGGIERVTAVLAKELTCAGHDVSVIAQRVDEGFHGRMTHIVREAPVFAPFHHEGIAVRQLRLSRMRRALLLPFAVELVPLVGRAVRKYLRGRTSQWYAWVARPQLLHLLRHAHVVHILGGDLLASAVVEAGHINGQVAVITPFAHPGDWGLDAASVHAYRSCDAVVATTEADADVYREVGVTNDRLAVIGVPVPGLRLAESGVDQAKGAEEPVVLFLGARRATKNVDLLLRAAEEVWKRRPDVCFAFVGPGEPLGYPDPRILDVGEVADRERQRWLSRSVALCLPSASESFGIVVAEAWSTRTPVVVSDIPVLRELVTRSAGGIVAQLSADAMASALLRLVEDRAMAARMGEAGHRYWDDNYQPTVVVNRHLELYRRLLARSRPMPG